MIAIRIRGLSRYAGIPLEMDGAARPRAALRSLMRIAGVDLKPSDDAVQTTVVSPGYVLRDVSLDIERGSVVCLTGASGSGKSLLLRILAGTVPPTTGTVEIYGGVTALLSMGQNLDVRRTAQENIRASKMVAKATPDQAARYAADVLDFAELHGFEHAPIRTYSSGMVIRLNVALALCGSPSIVLIDDVLGVGDIAFQQKCVERVLALKDAGCTLVLAFSDDALVQQLASRVVTLGAGRVISDTSGSGGEPAARAGNVEISCRVFEGLPEDDVLVFRSITVDTVPEGDETYLDLRLAVAPKMTGLRCRPVLSVLSETAVLLFRSVCPEFVGMDGADSVTFTVKVPTRMLPTGRYTLAAAMATRQGDRVFATKANDAVTVTVRRDGTPAVQDGTAPLLQPALSWDVAAVDAAQGA